MAPKITLPVVLPETEEEKWERVRMKRLRVMQSLPAPPVLEMYAPDPCLRIPKRLWEQDVARWRHLLDLYHAELQRLPPGLGPEPEDLHAEPEEPSASTPERKRKREHDAEHVDLGPAANDPGAASSGPGGHGAPSAEETGTWIETAEETQGPGETWIETAPESP